MKRQHSAKKLGISVLAWFLLLSGCSLTVPPVSREYLVISTVTKFDNAKASRLLIFNASNPLMFMATGRLNVLLNGKGAAQLDISEYIVLLVPRGKYRVDLLHHDVARFSSTHEIDIYAHNTYLEVKATILSNSAKIVSELPSDFKQNFYTK